MLRTNMACTPQYDLVLYTILSQKRTQGLRVLRQKKMKPHFIHLQDRHFINPLTLFKILSVPKIAKDITIFNRQ